MKAHWLTIKARYWDSRTARERQVLGTLALVLLPVTVYWAAWQPAHAALEKLHAVVPAMRTQSAQMTLQAAEVTRLRHLPQPAALDAATLQATIEQAASRHQLRDALSTLTPHESNTVRITLASVSFAQWLALLRELQQEQHIRAASISMTALPEPGKVSITATLTNGESP